jgi:hypothetical protein
VPLSFNIGNQALRANIYRVCVQIRRHVKEQLYLALLALPETDNMKTALDKLAGRSWDEDSISATAHKMQTLRQALGLQVH